MYFILRYVVAILLHHVGLSWCDRLFVPEGGYARIFGIQQNSIDQFTLSAWVNISQFPEGISPLLTYLNEDATSQISFFLRPSSVGVLWGGPKAEQNPQSQVRRPRQKQLRTKRDATYSDGLGNIESILGSRKPRNNVWSPLNFVDVAVFGVDDLDMSSSAFSERGGAPYREGKANEKDFSGWTNVPYELHMQESAKVGESEPKIITEPEGDDEFVYINWNNQPQAPNKKEQLEDNSWSPVWNDQKQKAHSVPIIPQQSQNSQKYSQRATMDLSNSWNPVNIPAVKPPNSQIPAWVYETQFDKQPVKSQPHKITVSDKLLPVQNSRVPSNDNPSTVIPRSQIVPQFRYTPIPILTTPKTVKTTRFIPTTARPTTTIKTTEKSERKPLWMLIKKPQSETRMNPPPLPKLTTPRPPPKKRPHKEYKSSASISRPTVIHPKVTVPKPKYSASNSKWQQKKLPHKRPMPHHRLPPQTLYKKERPTTERTTTTTTTTTTRAPIIRKVTPKPSPKTRRPYIPKIPPTRAPDTKPKFSYQPSGYSKFISNKYTNEFEKSMKDPVMVKEGKKAVVYSVPITNEEEYYKMYEKYHSQNTEKPNLHKLYEKMRLGEVPEEEVNENELEEANTQIQTPQLVEIDPIEEKQVEMTEKQYEIKEDVLSDDVNDVDDYIFYDYIEEEENDNDQWEPKISGLDYLLQSSKNRLNHDSYSLANLYRPILPTAQELEPQPSNYQQPQNLFHEQLPPTYEKPEKDLAVMHQVPKEPTEKPIQQNQYFIPDEILASSLLPRPVHETGPKKKTEESNPTEIKSQTLPQIPPLIYNDTLINDYPSITTTYIGEDVPAIIISDEDNPLNIYLKEVPYEFQEDGWFHVAYTWSRHSNRLGVFVNGERIGEIKNIDDGFPKITNNGLFMLGRTLLPDLSDFDDSSQYVGEMSDVNIWAQEFSPGEVDAMFQCKYQPNVEQPLVWNQTPMKFYNNAGLIHSPPFCGVIT